MFVRALTLATLASAAMAANAPHPASLTIVLDFKGPHSQRSIEAMKHEVETILQGAALKLDWRMRGEAAPEAFDNLVLVRFKGRCVLEPVGYLYDERGPLAFTYSTSGVVQPFSEVACDQVAAAARSAMHGGDFSKSDLLMGRALGRVVAHELVHILSGSAAHGHEGVAKRALSPSQLVSPSLPLSPADLERIYTEP